MFGLMNNESINYPAMANYPALLGKYTDSGYFTYLLNEADKDSGISTPRPGSITSEYTDTTSSSPIPPPSEPEALIESPYAPSEVSSPLPTIPEPTPTTYTTPSGTTMQVAFIHGAVNTPYAPVNVVKTRMMDGSFTISANSVGSTQKVKVFTCEEMEKQTALKDQMMKKFRENL